MTPASLTTFLVETYVSGLDAVSAARLDRRMQESVERLRSTGLDVGWGGSLAISSEETYCALVICHDVAVTEVVCAGADVRSDHVVAVLDSLSRDRPATSGPWPPRATRSASPS